MAADFIQVNAIDGAADGSGTTVAPTSLNVTTGNLLVVGVRWESGGLNDAATATISDTAGNTYQLIGYMATGSGSEDQKVGLWYVLAATGHATNIITATLSAARTFKAIFVAQYSYTGTIELGATGSGSSSSNVTAQTTSPSLSAVAGDLVVGWFANYNSGPPTFTADSPFTIRSSSIYARYLEYIVVTGTSFAPSITADGSGDTYAARSAVFQEASAGGTVNTQTLTSTAAVVDAFTAFLTRNRSLTSSITVTEGPTDQQATYNVETFSETIIADELVLWLRRTRLLQDDIQITDDFIAQAIGYLIYTSVLSSNVIVTDQALKTAYFYRLMESNVVTADQILRALLLARDLLDGVEVTDSSLTAMQRFILLTDTVSLEDSLTALYVPHQLVNPLIRIGFDQPQVELGGYSVN